MDIFDVALLLLLSGFVFFGAFFGLIHTLGALIGVIFGALIASFIFSPIATFIAFLFQLDPDTSHVIVFIVIFITINRLVGFGFYLVEKVFGIIEKLPFIKTISKLGGAILGFVEGILVIGLCLFVAIRFDIGSFWLSTIGNSDVALWMIQVSQNLKPLLPFGIAYLQSLI